jgi:uncharacterized membrane protein
VVPIFPWFGVVLLGVALMRWLQTSPLLERLRAVHSNQPLVRGIALLGRWSLPFYLLHQPVIIGILYGLMMLQGQPVTPPVVNDIVGFTTSCNASCTANGWAADQCEQYCSCALEQIEERNLWEVMSNPEAPEVAQLRNLCTGMYLK